MSSISFSQMYYRLCSSPKFSIKRDSEMHLENLSPGNWPSNSIILCQPATPEPPLAEIDAAYYLMNAHHSNAKLSTLPLHVF
jgi:hypothetical protein